MIHSPFDSLYPRWMSDNVDNMQWIHLQYIATAYIPVHTRCDLNAGWFSTNQQCPSYNMYTHAHHRSYAEAIDEAVWLLKNGQIQTYNVVLTALYYCNYDQSRLTILLLLSFVFYYFIMIFFIWKWFSQCRRIIMLSKFLQKLSTISCLLAGLSGDVCEMNNDDCIDHQCMNGAVCQDLVNSYRCICPDGGQFTGDRW